MDCCLFVCCCWCLVELRGDRQTLLAADNVQLSSLFNLGVAR